MALFPLDKDSLAGSGLSVKQKLKILFRIAPAQNGIKAPTATQLVQMLLTLFSGCKLLAENNDLHFVVVCHIRYLVHFLLL